VIQEIENTWVIADKSYDSNAFVEEIEKKGCTPVIPSTKKQKTSSKL
jgi:hypothetical protein